MLFPPKLSPVIRACVTGVQLWSV